MSNDQTMIFTPGTLVWVKVYNRIWWPCRVVDPKTAPDAVQEYMLRKKNPKAMVFFERESKYDIIINMDKVSLYSCPKKMEFIKKGYTLYLKEEKGIKTQNVEMMNFIKDVIKFEEEINGDVNIFKQFEKKDEEHAPPPKELIKELFVSAKVLDKKKCTRNSTPNFKSSVKKITPLSSPSPVLKKRKSSINSQSSSSEFVCHLKDSCNFTTTRYEALKRHMALCKILVEVPTTKLELKVQSMLQIGDKQSNITKKNSTKLNNEVLKDCEVGEKMKIEMREDKDDDNSLNHDAKPGCSTMLIENNEMILHRVNDEITNIATNATENIENLEDLKTIEKDHEDTIPSGVGEKMKIEMRDDKDDDDNSLNHDVKPGCSTMLTENNEMILDRVNDEITNIATNATENIENLEDLITIEKDHEDTIPSVTNTINEINIGYEDNLLFEEKVEKNVLSTSLQNLIEGFSNQDIEEIQSCSTGVVLDSETEKIDDRTYSGFKEEEIKQAFLNIIMNSGKPLDLYLGEKVDSKEDETETHQLPFHAKWYFREINNKDFEKYPKEGEKVDSKKDETKTHQLPSDVELYHKEINNKDFEKYPNEERKLSVEKSNQASIANFCYEIEHSSTVNVCSEQLKESSDSSEIVIMRTFIQIPASYPMPDDEEDITKWNTYPKIIDKLDEWNVGHDPNADAT